VKITLFGTGFSAYNFFTHLTGDIHPCSPSDYALVSYRNKILLICVQFTLVYEITLLAYF